MTQICNIADLAAHLGAYEDSERSIARRVYKDTTCGCPAGVYVEQSSQSGIELTAWGCASGPTARSRVAGFYVAGYCEGSDWEHPVYKVAFPCTPGDIDKAIAKADKDGCATWDETHACEQCFPEGNCDQYGNEFPPGEAGGPINPECTGCGGGGVVL